MDRLCKLTLLLHCLILLVILLYQDLKYPKKGGFQFFDQVTPDFWGVENTPHRTIFLTILNIPYRVIILCGWAVYINFMVIVHHQDHKYPKIGGFQFFDLVTPHFWGGEKFPMPCTQLLPVSGTPPPRSNATAPSISAEIGDAVRGGRGGGARGGYSNKINFTSFQDDN